jgi:hypothetical protein
MWCDADFQATSFVFKYCSSSSFVSSPSFKLSVHAFLYYHPLHLTQWHTMTVSPDIAQLDFLLLIKDVIYDS